MHNRITTPNSRCLSLACDAGLQGSMSKAFRVATAVLGGYPRMYSKRAALHPHGNATCTPPLPLPGHDREAERTAAMQGVLAHRTHLSLTQHSHSLRGGLPMRAEAPEDADGLRHEANMAHHCHPCTHYCPSSCHSRAAPTCTKTTFDFWQCHRTACEIGCAHATHSRPHSDPMTAPNPWPFRRETEHQALAKRTPKQMYMVCTWPSGHLQASQRP